MDTSLLKKVHKNKTRKTTVTVGNQSFTIMAFGQDSRVKLSIKAQALTFFRSIELCFVTKHALATCVNLALICYYGQLFWGMEASILTRHDYNM